MKDEFLEEDEEFLDGDSFSDNDTAEDTNKETKKVALFTIGLGLVLLVIMCILIRVYKSSGDGYDTTVSKDTYVENEVSIHNSNNNQPKEGEKDVISGHNLEVDWQIVDTPINLKQKRVGKFIVDEIYNYAKNMETSIQLKTVVVGRLEVSSEVRGYTYEIEVPNKYSNSIRVGSELSVQFIESRLGDKTVIGDIEIFNR